MNTMERMLINFVEFWGSAISNYGALRVLVEWIIERIIKQRGIRTSETCKGGREDVLPC